MVYCHVKKIKCSGRFVSISISDNDRYFWRKFENEATKKKQTIHELFKEICDSQRVNQDDLLKGKGKSSKIKKILIDHYSKSI